MAIEISQSAHKVERDMDITETMDTSKAFAPGRSEDELRELMALARLLTFAQGTAKTLNAGFVEYCLDMAVSGILEELHSNDKFKLRN
ncbi:hypothetical protein [Paramesorhizobium deserti]|uniref:hypothetical protein n=1 Tax=Paramesorhizobium deserti TaxID=1494590 RepID=UPI0012905461|nr:hypothetical protein [Paramesorhizobium deserti]